MKVVVLGIGNVLLRDEGVGVHAVGSLREGYHIPGEVKLIDGGTMGLDLLSFIEGAEKVLIIDATDFGEKAGTIKILENNDVPAFLSTKFSVHQIGVSDMLFAAKFIGITPPHLCLIGIQPAKIDTGLGISPELEDKFQDLLRVITEKLGEWGVDVKRKDHVSCSPL